jgi:hypothetical protein
MYVQPEVSATSTIKLKKDALLLKSFIKNSVKMLNKELNEDIESII